MEVISPKVRSVASSPFTSPNIGVLLKIKIISWSQETGLPVSVRIRVGDRIFNLHKHPLLSKSGYFQKRLNESTEYELPSDFPGGPETFELLALFIYGSSTLVDPFNVAALRCAAEFLEMTGNYCSSNLCERFDIYLNQVVFQSWDDTLIVLQKCQQLLPWSEDLLIVSRCIESLAFMACMEILDPERRRDQPVVTIDALASQVWSCEMVKEILCHDLWIKDLIGLPFEFFKRVVGSLRRQGMKEKYVNHPTSESTSESLPLIVYFHGGGFVYMAPDSKLLDDFCQSLAREIHAVVISVNYRLAPEHRCPCQYEDGFDVLKFIDGDGSSFEGLPANVDLKRCFVAGDSAGGNIAHHMILKSGDHEFRELEIIGLIAIQPFFGGEERTESDIRLIKAPLSTIDRTDWYWKAFLPEGFDRDHPSVNIFGPKSVDISKVRFPAIKVLVGGLDPLIDWQKRYYEGLKKSGKEAYLTEYPNAFHSFYGFPELPEWSEFIKDVADFIAAQCSKKSS